MTNKFDDDNIPAVVPTVMVRGDYIRWRLLNYHDDYPDASYDLLIVFRREEEPAREINVAGVEDSDGYLFTITSSTSADFEIGRYHWDLYVTRTSDSERITLDQGQTRIEANKADDSTDPRSFPRKMVYEIERALLGRATNNQLDTLAYSLGIETSGTRDPNRLKELREVYREELINANRKWRARKGKPHSGVIKVRF